MGRLCNSLFRCLVIDVTAQARLKLKRVYTRDEQLPVSCVSWLPLSIHDFWKGVCSGCTGLWRFTGYRIKCSEVLRRISGTVWRWFLSMYSRKGGLIVVIQYTRRWMRDRDTFCLRKKKFLLVNPKERGHLKELWVDGKIILNRLLKRVQEGCQC